MRPMGRRRVYSHPLGRSRGCAPGEQQGSDLGPGPEERVTEEVCGWGRAEVVTQGASRPGSRRASVRPAATQAGRRGNSLVRYAGETYDNIILVGGFSKA